MGASLGVELRIEIDENNLNKEETVSAITDKIWFEGIPKEEVIAATEGFLSKHCTIDVGSEEFTTQLQMLYDRLPNSISISKTHFFGYTKSVVNFVSLFTALNKFKDTNQNHTEAATLNEKNLHEWNSMNESTVPTSTASPNNTGERVVKERVHHITEHVASASSYHIPERELDDARSKSKTFFCISEGEIDLFIKRLPTEEIIEKIKNSHRAYHRQGYGTILFYIPENRLTLDYEDFERQRLIINHNLYQFFEENRTRIYDTIDASQILPYNRREYHSYWDEQGIQLTQEGKKVLYKNLSGNFGSQFDGKNIILPDGSRYVKQFRSSPSVQPSHSHGLCPPTPQFGTQYGNGGFQAMPSTQMPPPPLPNLEAGQLRIPNAFSNIPSFATAVAAANEQVAAQQQKVFEDELRMQEQFKMKEELHRPFLQKIKAQPITAPIIYPAEQILMNGATGPMGSSGPRVRDPTPNRRNIGFGLNPQFNLPTDGGYNPQMDITRMPSKGLNNNFPDGPTNMIGFNDNNEHDGGYNGLDITQIQPSSHPNGTMDGLPSYFMQAQISEMYANHNPLMDATMPMHQPPMQQPAVQPTLQQPQIFQPPPLMMVEQPPVYFEQQVRKHQPAPPSNLENMDITRFPGAASSVPPVSQPEFHVQAQAGSMTPQPEQPMATEFTQIIPRNPVNYGLPESVDLKRTPSPSPVVKPPMHYGAPDNMDLNTIPVQTKVRGVPADMLTNPTQQTQFGNNQGVDGMCGMYMGDPSPQVPSAAATIIPDHFDPAKEAAIPAPIASHKGPISAPGFGFAQKQRDLHNKHRKIEDNLVMNMPRGDSDATPPVPPVPSASMFGAPSPEKPSLRPPHQGGFMNSVIQTVQDALATVPTINSNELMSPKVQTRHGRQITSIPIVGGMEGIQSPNPGYRQRDIAMG